MLLTELFTSGGVMTNRLRQAVLDIITPLLGEHVPFITIDQITDALRNRDLGVAVDRGLIMQLLDPNEISAVSEIKGDRVYLAKPAAPDQAQNDADKQKERERSSQKAQQQAKKETTPSPPPAPPPKPPKAAPTPNK